MIFERSPNAQDLIKEWF